MNLITMSVKLAAKEAKKEVTKEAIEIAKGLSEFGKVGSEVVAERISLGKLGEDACESQIGFGSNEEIFLSEDDKLAFGTHDEIDKGLENSLDVEDTKEYDVLLEPQVSFRGGLSACSADCIFSHCYPVDLLKGIGTQNPRKPNSKMGHT